MQSCQNMYGCSVVMIKGDEKEMHAVSEIEIQTQDPKYSNPDLWQHWNGDWLSSDTEINTNTFNTQTQIERKKKPLSINTHA